MNSCSVCDLGAVQKVVEFNHFHVCVEVNHYFWVGSLLYELPYDPLQCTTAVVIFQAKDAVVPML